MREPIRIAVAEDDELMRTLIVDSLRDGGYEVSEARNGRELCTLSQKRHFDLYISDLLMPDQEGLETISQLRKQGVKQPILVISGWFGQKFFSAAGLMGATATLPKPFLPASLLEEVRYLLANED